MEKGVKIIFDIFFRLYPISLLPYLLLNSPTQRLPPPSRIPRQNKFIPCMALDVTCMRAATIEWVRKGRGKKIEREREESVIKTEKVFNIQMVVQTDSDKTFLFYKTVITRFELFIWYFFIDIWLCFCDFILKAKHVLANNIETVKVCVLSQCGNVLIIFLFIRGFINLMAAAVCSMVTDLYYQRKFSLHLFQTLSVLNPFRATEKTIFEDTDLAGPLVFCLAFGGFLLLVSFNKITLKEGCLRRTCTLKC